jgi:hypothetical protein
LCEFLILNRFTILFLFIYLFFHLSLPNRMNSDTLDIARKLSDAELLARAGELVGEDVWAGQKGARGSWAALGCRLAAAGDRHGPPFAREFADEAMKQVIARRKGIKKMNKAKTRPQQMTHFVLETYNTTKEQIFDCLHRKTELEMNFGGDLSLRLERTESIFSVKDGPEEIEETFLLRPRGATSKWRAVVFDHTVARDDAETAKLLFHKIFRALGVPETVSSRQLLCFIAELAMAHHFHDPEKEFRWFEDMFENGEGFSELNQEEVKEQTEFEFFFNHLNKQKDNKMNKHCLIRLMPALKLRPPS